MKGSGDRLSPGLSHRYCYIRMVKNKLRDLLHVLKAKYCFALGRRHSHVYL